MTPQPILRQRSRLPIALGTTAALLVAVLVLAPSIAVVSATSLAPPTTGSPPTGSWSFGNTTSIVVHGKDYQGTYNGTADYGFVTNVTAVNTSSTTVEVSMQETVGISFQLQYCRPNCANPIQVTQFYYQAWQTREAWTNVSTVANVTETFANTNGTTSVVNALGVINSTGEGRGTIRESAVDVRHGANNVTLVSSENASLTYSSNSTIAFAPALGLLPTGPLLPGDAWVSSAAYQAQADWGARWVVNLSGPRGGSVVTLGSIEVNVPATSGTVTLVGLAGESAVRVNATRLLTVGYSIVGANLVVGPGLAVGWALPGAFGEGLPGSSSWSSKAIAGAQVQLSAIGALPSGRLATRLRASQVTFSLRVHDPNNGNGVNDSVPQSEVTGGPMTSSQASSTASCLVQSGICAATVGGSTGGLVRNAALLLVLGSVVVLAVLIAAVLVARQRRIPPPQYPNAGLYPPGQPLSMPPTRPTDPKTQNRSPTDRPDDPLDQLW